MPSGDTSSKRGQVKPGHMVHAKVLVGNTHGNVADIFYYRKLVSVGCVVNSYIESKNQRNKITGSVGPLCPSEDDVAPLSSWVAHKVESVTRCALL